MYQKFIINQDGVLKFGHVYLHKDLLARDERCPYGGGLWKIDEGRRAILLYGRSFDFGAPDFHHLRRIEWTGVGGQPLPLFYLPHWPEEDLLIPVFDKATQYIFLGGCSISSLTIAVYLPRRL